MYPKLFDFGEVTLWGHSFELFLPTYGFLLAIGFLLVPGAYGDDASYYRAQGVAIGVASTLMLDHLLDGHNRGSSVVHVDYRYGDGAYGRGYTDLARILHE